MPLQPEDQVHDEIKQKLEEIGWLNGNKVYGKVYGIKEHSQIENYYIPKILEKKVKEINEEIFAKLTPSEEKYVIEHIHNELKNADEIRILDYLKYGVEVFLNTREETLKIKLIDDKSAFFYLHEAKYKGFPENSKPDFTLFINGIPIAIIEAKSEFIPYSHSMAIKQIRRYEIFSPDLFRFVQFGVAYGDDKLYTPTMPNWTKEERDLPAFNWVLRVNGERKSNIFDLLKPERIVEFIKYFIFYTKPREGEIGKLMARQNQYRATKKAIKRIREYMENTEMNRGLVWHWQGSGKTYTMFFIANYFLDLYYHTHPIVFFVVDREDIENQHERVLKAVQDKKFRSLFKKVESISNLGEIITTAKRSEMTENIIPRGVYLTTIQKFQKGRGGTEGLTEKEDKEITKELYSLLINLGNEYLNHLREKYPEEYRKHIQNIESLDEKGREKYLLKLGGVKRKNILFLIDEAHRSHYGLLGAMRKTSFPSSITFGFTGTPIFKHERNTFLEFSYPDRGEYYLDVYFIEDSIKDGFTLPIIYQVVKEGEIKAEGVRIRLTEEEIADFIKEYMEKKGKIENLLNMDISRSDISRHITKAKVILLNEKRIDKLAEYIANRIKEDTEGFKYKAMVVAVNRVGCVRYKKALDKHLSEKFGNEYDDVKDWTEIVMTYNYNDTNPEIVKYRQELIKRRKNNDLKRINEEIQNDFLEKKNPKILIVTDMLLTGFDAPMLKVMYLDKPLYEHRLLQAIARVNRPYKDKNFGLIVDSFGLMDNLAKTMKIYNMLAEEEIKKDFEMNLMRAVEQKFSEFEIKLRDVKECLKNLRVGDEDVGIDLDFLKEAFRTRRGKEEIQTKIATIAMLYVEDKDFSAAIIRLVNEIRTLFKLYKALGAYPEKLSYVDDVDALAYIYYKLKRILAGKRVKPGKEFWNELLSYIHNKTMIDDFKEVGEAELKPEKIEKLIEDLTDENEIRKRVINAVADFFFNLRSILNEKRHDPVYRQIMEKLERLRLDWIRRKINTRTFLTKLKEMDEEIAEYHKEIYGKLDEERILETLNHYIKQRTGRKIDLKNTRIALKEVLDGNIRIFTPQYEKRIRTELLKDMFLGNVTEQDAKRIVEELVEYIEKELNRLWRKEN